MVDFIVALIGMRKVNTIGIEQANKVMIMAVTAYRTLLCLIIWFFMRLCNGYYCWLYVNFFKSTYSSSPFYLI